MVSNTMYLFRVSIDFSIFFFSTTRFQVRVHVRRAMKVSCHGGCTESTKGPDISSYSDIKNLGLVDQGASVRFGVTRRVRHVLHSHHSGEFQT